MINSYDEIILSSVSQADQTIDISSITIRYFNDLFKQVIQRVKKEFIIDNYKNIYGFFKSAFGLPLTFNKNNNGKDLPQITEVEDAIAQSYEQFVIKMNDE